MSNRVINQVLQPRKLPFMVQLLCWTILYYLYLR